MIFQYIAATEKLCQSIEQGVDDESVERAQQIMIRNTTVSHIEKEIGMKIKSNISAEDHKLTLQTCGTSIVIWPADKGKIIVIEDHEHYVNNY